VRNTWENVKADVPVGLQQKLRAPDDARVDVLIESIAANIEVAGIFTPKGVGTGGDSAADDADGLALRLAVPLGREARATHVDPARLLSGMDR